MTYDFIVFKGSSTGEIHESKSQRPQFTRDEVFIDITHSGVCGTDEHFKWVDMGLGHEGVGVVKEVGPEVKTLKVGDRVGWGYVVETCGVCDQCLAGTMVYCTGGKKEYGQGNTDQGSFGCGAVWKEQYLFKLPDDLPSDVAAPLMCARITVFSPLARFGLKSTDVGVVGIGGLGHLAIQFASKMGCEVFALSGTGEKREEAFKLGATHFVATKGVKLLSVPRKIDHLLVTTSKMPDWLTTTQSSHQWQPFAHLQLRISRLNWRFPSCHFCSWEENLLDRRYRRRSCTSKCLSLQLFMESNSS